MTNHRNALLVSAVTAARAIIAQGHNGDGHVTQRAADACIVLDTALSLHADRGGVMGSETRREADELRDYCRAMKSRFAPIHDAAARGEISGAEYGLQLAAARAAQAAYEATTH
jgi:hypothetical protein